MTICIHEHWENGRRVKPIVVVILDTDEEPIKDIEEVRRVFHDGIRALPGNYKNLSVVVLGKKAKGDKKNES